MPLNKWYVDKRTIGEEPDIYGNINVVYRQYPVAMTWEEIKVDFSPEEIDNFVLVNDFKIMRDILDPGRKRETKGRKENLTNLVTSIFRTLVEEGNLDGDPTHMRLGMGKTLDDSLEESTYDIQYSEAVAFRDTGYVNISLCPNISILATTTGRNIKELTDKIIYKHEEQSNKVFKYLGYKQKNLKHLETIEDPDKLSEMEDNLDWMDFGPEITTDKLLAWKTANLPMFSRYYDPVDMGYDDQE